MCSRMNYLSASERTAVDDCVIRLPSALGEDLVGVWLFGSKARGDFGLDSDIDLLVVLRDWQPQKRWRIREIAAQCSLKHDVLFNVHIIDQGRWNDEVNYQGTLWREIQRDGVPLLPEAAPA